jgi:hypothetical protein
MRISEVALRKQLMQRHFLKCADTQNLESCGETSLQAEFLAHNRYQDVNTDRDPDLGADRILRSPVEVTDSQVPLDPFAEQLDPPATLVEQSDKETSGVRSLLLDILLARGGQHAQGRPDGPPVADRNARWLVAPDQPR